MARKKKKSHNSWLLVALLVSTGTVWLVIFVWLVAMGVPRLLHHDAAAGGAPATPAQVPNQANTLPGAPAQEPRIRSDWWRCTDQQRAASDALARQRRELVKAAMVHTWQGYRERAWGKDEIMPTSGGHREDWGGMGMMILDSLDTLWLLGMRAEFHEAVEWMHSRLDFARVGVVSVFETTIRALGGLLGAHTVSGKTFFLASKANELGERLMPAFETPSGLASPWLNLSDGRAPPKERTSLAEAGSLQLEFRYLSLVALDPKYGSAAARAHGLLYERFRAQRRASVDGGLFPVHIGLARGNLSGGYSFGSQGDSFYEYLLKCWLMEGRQPGSPLLEMYEAAVKSLRERMLRTSQPGGLRYINGEKGRMEHLACFVPGMLALGAHMRPQAPSRREEFALAEDLARTCHEMYRRTATGLAPEAVVFGRGRGPDFKVDAPHNTWNLLRPEAVESFFVLHELTGDPKYREWGHDVFEALERHSRAPFGYGAHPDVTKPDRACCQGNDDKEPTFFAAETLKYLYLLQDPDHQISLEKYVFNTEAHPLPLPPPQRVPGTGPSET